MTDGANHFDRLKAEVSTPENMAMLDQAQSLFDELLSHVTQAHRDEQAGDFLGFVEHGAQVAEILVSVDRDTMMTLATGAITVIARNVVAGE